MKLIIVRHGESEGNTKEIFAGVTDVPLTEKGMEQARKTAEHILENYNIDKIYSSPLKRAYNTAVPVSKKLGLEIEKREKLMEIYGGEWEAVRFADLSELYAEDYRIWMEDQCNAVCTGGESVKELYDRIYKEVLSIAQENEGKCVLITTHATPVKVLACRILYDDVKKVSEIGWVSNASVTEIDYEDGKFSVVKLGYDKHLGTMATVLPESI